MTDQPSTANRQLSNCQLKIVAAIPCFNTGPFIADVVSKAKKYVDQVIVIDDGSHDGTAEVAKAAGALVIRHEVNMGPGEATKSCFEAGRANGTDILVTLDGDAQHNPDEIARLLAPIINKEADIVIGSRFIQPTESISQESRVISPPPRHLTGDSGLKAQDSRLTTMPRYRKFGINVITLLFNLGSRTKVSDAQSCFRAYSRKAFNSLSITEKGFGFSVQLLIDARQKGLVITEVPISCVYHSASHTLNPVVHGLSVALSVVRIRLKNSLHSLIRGSNARNQGS